MGVFGGKVQPDLKLTKKVSVKFKNQDGTTVEQSFGKDSTEEFLSTMLGYMLAKYGYKYCLEKLTSWDLAEVGKLEDK